MFTLSMDCVTTILFGHYKSIYYLSVYFKPDIRRHDIRALKTDIAIRKANDPTLMEGL